LIAPADAPTTKSGCNPADNRPRNMPTWIAPRLPPPANANAVFCPVRVITARFESSIRGRKSGTGGFVNGLASVCHAPLRKIALRELCKSIDAQIFP
jgi:hypothetical protein